MKKIFWLLILLVALGLIGFAKPAKAACRDDYVTPRIEVDCGSFDCNDLEIGDPINVTVENMGGTDSFLIDILASYTEDKHGSWSGKATDQPLGPEETKTFPITMDSAGKHYIKVVVSDQSAPTCLVDSNEDNFVIVNRTSSSIYNMPTLNLNCSPDCGNATAGEPLYLTLGFTGNSPSDSFKYYVYMTRASSKADDQYYQKAEGTADGGTIATESLGTYSTTRAGLHYLKVVVFHEPDGARVGYNDTLSFTVADNGTNSGAVPDPDDPGPSDPTDPGSKPAPSAGKIHFPWDVTVTDFPSLVQAIISWLVGLAGGLAVLAIVYSGIMYMTSGGDPTKAENAKKNLIWAITGVVIVFLSYVIVQWIGNIITGAP